MKIYFKNVGQGDSIILSWEEEEEKKIAIIDCHKPSAGLNPTLNHFISSGAKKIEFIILTHPHYDHYSGMNELLDYCAGNLVQIKAFFHTCNTIPESLKASVKGNIATRELEILFENIDNMALSGKISDVWYLDDNSQLIYTDKLGKWPLKILSPSHSEFFKFKQQAYAEDIRPKVNSSCGNLLSTIVRLGKEDKYVILTSDAVIGTFERLYNKGLVNFPSAAVLGQIPHHGSNHNFHKDFWKKVRTKSGSLAAISTSGKEYGHPSPVVIERLKQLNYSVHQTNELRSSPSSTSLLLDLVSVKSSVLSAPRPIQHLEFDLDLI